MKCGLSNEWNLNYRHLQTKVLSLVPQTRSMLFKTEIMDRELRKIQLAYLGEKSPQNKGFLWHTKI